jgi:hypothetical protein
MKALSERVTNGKFRSYRRRKPVLPLAGASVAFAPAIPTLFITTQPKPTGSAVVFAQIHQLSVQQQETLHERNYAIDRH